MSMLLRPTTPPLWLGVVVAASFIVTESLVLLALKHLVHGNAFGVAFLVGVLVVSTVWEFGLAVMTSLASAVAFDYFRNRPGDFMPANAENWITIGIFVVVALVTNTVAYLARSRAVEAERRRLEAEASRDELRRLAQLQAALRHVATLVAHAVPSSEVFTAVAEELAQYLGVPHAALLRYETDGTAVVLAARDAEAKKMRVGMRFSFQGESVAAMVFRTGRAARIDSHDAEAGPDAKYITELGIHSGVGSPIVVDGRLWGAAVVGSLRPHTLPPDTEERVRDFADLAATAIADAEARAELTASRARIVAAGDNARRRFERDLHDGAQQRLVSLGLKLRTAEASVPPELRTLRDQISDIVTGLTGVSADLQETSRGIHPAILSRGGLGPALKTLARRSAVPVELRVDVDQRLPDPAEVGAYYLVAEALTNAAKHAQASEVRVRVEADAASLHVSIRDDGVGGADLRKGSGLIGLTDRVEALGGRLQISSIAGHGTSLTATIPLDVRPAPADHWHRADRTLRRNRMWGSGADEQPRLGDNEPS
jgi:signal transduction histidine kinase